MDYKGVHLQTLNFMKTQMVKAAHVSGRTNLMNLQTLKIIDNSELYLTAELISLIQLREIS